jgi:hypothetical protein
MKKFRSIHPYVMDYHFYFVYYTKRYPNYDGSFVFERYMGTLKWSEYQLDSQLIDKVRKKFNKIQCTFNSSHNGFSVDYVKESECDAIYKFLVKELRLRYKDNPNFPERKNRNVFKRYNNETTRL